MNIFNREPSNWKELQSFVGQMFRECGFDTHVSKTVDLVRGNKEIDVYAQDLSSEFKSIIFVECKFWNKPVSQETIHAFRTVINDFGANVGYIVSKTGFQVGSYKAAKNTNIKLVSIDELEQIFHLKWRREMVKKYSSLIEPLRPYWHYALKPQVDCNEQPIDFNRQLLIGNAYAPICDLAFPNYFEDGFVKYPFKVPIITYELHTIGYLEIKNDRGYFDFCEKNKDEVLKRYKILFKEICL